MKRIDEIFSECNTDDTLLVNPVVEYHSVLLFECHPRIEEYGRKFILKSSVKRLHNQIKHLLDMQLNGRYEILSPEETKRFPLIDEMKKKLRKNNSFTLDANIDPNKRELENSFFMLVLLDEDFPADDCFIKFIASLQHIRSTFYAISIYALDLFERETGLDFGVCHHIDYQMMNRCRQKLDGKIKENKLSNQFGIPWVDGVFYTLSNRY